MGPEQTPDGQGTPQGGTPAPAEPQTPQTPPTGQAGATPAPAATETPFETITWNGQSVHVKSKDEGRMLMQKGYDYTQKMQELSAREKQIDALIKELEAMPNAGEATPANPDNPPAPEVSPLEKKVSELSTWKESREKEERQHNMEATLSPLREKFSALKDQAFEDYALFVFANAAQAGKVPSSEEGLTSIVEQLSKAHDASLTAAVDKVLANREDPRIKKVLQEALKDYTSGKLKFEFAAGETGGAAPAPARDAGPNTISEARRRSIERTIPA